MPAGHCGRVSDLTQQPAQWQRGQRLRIERKHIDPGAASGTGNLWFDRSAQMQYLDMHRGGLGRYNQTVRRRGQTVFLLRIGDESAAQ